MCYTHHSLEDGLGNLIRDVAIRSMTHQIRKRSIESKRGKNTVVRTYLPQRWMTLVMDRRQAFRCACNRDGQTVLIQKHTKVLVLGLSLCDELNGVQTLPQHLSEVRWAFSYIIRQSRNPVAVLAP
jgi:hypothetical protein